MENLTTYEQQAIDFLSKTQTEIKIERTGHAKYFDDDKETRDIYTVSLTRHNKKPFVFTFGQSVANSGTLTENYKVSRAFERSGGYVPRKPSDFERKRKAPSAYDVLACLQKYEVGSFDNFCDDFGYDKDSRRAEKIYISVVNEYSELIRLFNKEEMELLREIQ